MAPEVIGFFTTILGQLQTDRLIRSKNSTEAFRVGPSAKNNHVAVDPSIQLDLNLKSRRNVRACASEIFWFHEVADPIGASGDAL